MVTTTPQDDWQRQVDQINIQLEQITSQPDSTYSTSRHSDSSDMPQETYFEVLQDAPDNYLAHPIQQKHTKIESTPAIHHKITKTNFLQ